MSIQVIDLTGHDTLLIRVPSLLTKEQRQKVVDDIKQVLPESKVVVIDGGFEVSILRNADATSALDGGGI